MEAITASGKNRKGNKIKGGKDLQLGENEVEVEEGFVAKGKYYEERAYYRNTYLHSGTGYSAPFLENSRYRSAD